MAQVGAISKAQKKQKYFKMSSILFYSTRNTQNLDRIGALNGGPFGVFNVYSVAKIKKNEGGPFEDIENFETKVSQCRKKQKAGTL